MGESDARGARQEDRPLGPCPTPGCDGDTRYAAPGRGHVTGCRYPMPTPAVPDPTVEALSEAERDEVVFQFYNAATSGEAIETVERILAARAAAPDALRVRDSRSLVEQALEEAASRIDAVRIAAQLDQGSSEYRAGLHHAVQLVRALLEDGAQ